MVQLEYAKAHQTRLHHWEENARFAIGVFRTDVARAGGCAEAAALAGQLQATSAEFRRLWAENEVRSHAVGLKRYRHPLAGLLTLEYSACAVDGAEGLSMTVFMPAAAVECARSRCCPRVLRAAAEAGRLTHKRSRAPRRP